MSESSIARRLALGLLRGAGGVLVSSLLVCGGTLAWLEAGDTRAPDHRVVDSTGLVEVDVDRIARPRTVEEVQALVARHEGPISIAGGRYSMGGQIAADRTLVLDTTGLDDVLALDVEHRTIRVEAGITWRQVIETIDPHGLSVKIMQSYANFTVGGTLSVNAHGRYVGLGPAIHSVRAIDLVLADGRLVHASRTENPELFFGAIGGYGALGVLVAAELDLAVDEKLERTVDRMPVGELRPWFAEHVAHSDRAVMFNADLYPPDYDEVVAITFDRTDRDVTVEERVQPPGGSTKTEQFVFWWVSEAPLGKQARSELIDRVRLSTKQVVWRNYEATYDVAQLDPGSREKSTYVLQEYFIPVDRFDAFVPKMRKVFQDHDVNVVNVSVRHAIPDPDTLLSWAPDERFAFVVYHKQKTTPEAWDEVGVWTRAMIDEILSVGGTYYLPYQIHATEAQFHQAYPLAGELFALKAEVDPDHVFQNRLWDAYLPHPPASDVAAVRARLEARPTWRRQEDQTFLTVPEWVQVYAADEQGAFLRDHRASEWPFFASLGQFWTTWRAVWGRTRDGYPFNGEYHTMIAVIGASWTLECVVKGLWEHSVGRFTEWASGPEPCPEELAYAAFVADYGRFIHHTPWYAYPFAERRAELAALEGGPWTLRRVERRVTIWSEYAVKGIYGALLGGASQAAYGTDEAVAEVWLRPGGADLGAVPGLTVLEDLGGGDVLVAIRRYEPFTTAVKALAALDVELVEVAGGDVMLVQVFAPRSWDRAALWGDVLVGWPVLTDPEHQRVTLEVAVDRLDEVLPALQSDGVVVERLYDY